MRKFDEKDFKVGHVVKVKVTNTYRGITTSKLYGYTYGFEFGETKTSIEYLLGVVFEDPADGGLVISYFADSKDDVNYEKRRGFDSASDLGISSSDDITYEILEVLEVGVWVIGSFDAETYMRERNLSVDKQCYVTIYPTDKDRMRTIVIDGKEIEIPEESYNKLKESLL
jgi:hypothetical protein